MTFDRHFAHWPPGQPKTLPVSTESVYSNLAASAARHAERAAIDYYGRRMSYGQLKGEVDSLAGYLQQRCGVMRGERVLLYLQNSPQFIIAYYAILRADAVVVPVNPMNLSEELRHYVEDSDARTAIVGEDVLPQLEPLGLDHLIVAGYADYLPSATDLPLPDFLRVSKTSRSWKEATTGGLTPKPHTAGPEDVAVMPYTSGTTGKPKGCIHTHSSVQATTGMYLRWRGAEGEGSVVLCALPMFHVTGMQAGMNSPIQLGATIVLLSRWDRDCAAMQIERARVTNWSAITTMMVDFLSSPKLSSYDLSSLRMLGGGGAAMPEALARRLEEVIGLPFVEGYGLTETMAPTHINPPQRPKRQCAGIPFFNTDARVIDHESKLELGAGEVGEIIVHGPQVFRGYWKQPEATAQAFI
ncbi:MAG TPA: AMP-binding protein, partial [Burkholderiales bacterium]|nr:AMP-binding protein [Burkholderiales bacterium]